MATKSKTPKPTVAAVATAVTAAETRATRFSALIPRLNTVECVVIGVGAVGRRIALDLAAIGVPRLRLHDPDTVEVANLGTQGWREAQVGRKKVVAIKDDIAEVNPECKVFTVAEKFAREDVESWPSINQKKRVAVFFCVDSIQTRGDIWKLVRDNADLVVDTRMGGETMRVIAVDDPPNDGRYQATLFTTAEAEQIRCTESSTPWTAMFAAATALVQFTRWLRDLPVHPEWSMNLKEGDLEVLGEAD